jgi:bifunctional DNA-binding transcriptional regulator/antitoxin component of YhaV-PrlF toxin-antitoxin module
MSIVLKITAKGQVTLRKEVLDHLGLQPGDQVAVDLRSPGHVDLSRPQTGSIEDFFGCLPDNGVRLSIEDINRVIEKGWSRR